MNTLKINGTDLSTYGIFLGSETYLDAPLIDYTAYDIPAKNGSVIQYNKRLNNVIRRFDCYIPESQNVQTAMDSLKKLLYSNVGYMKLESSYDTGTYQEGYLAQEIQVAPFNVGQSATFSLYFSCKPQKWYAPSAREYKQSYGLQYRCRVFPRSNGFIQAMLSALPSGAVPDDEAFLVIQVGGTGTSTNITGTWSEGSCFWAVVGGEGSGFPAYMPSDESDFGELCAYSNTTLSVPTVTITSTDLFVVTNVKMEGTLTVKRNGLTQFDTDLSTKIADYTNASAFGINATPTNYIVSFNSSPSTFAPDAVYRRTLINGSIVNESVLSIKWELMSADVLQELETNCMLNFTQDYGDYGVIMVVDYDKMKVICTGKSNYSDVDISQYVEIVGNINGMGDTIQTAMYYGGILGSFDAGMILEEDFAPQWWKL